MVLPIGCPTGDTDCVGERGGIFNPNTSSTWQSHGNYELYIERNLNITGAGEFGNDTVSLGDSGGPTLDDQIVGGIAAADYFIGIFGINPKPTNFTSLDDGQASYLTTLKNQNLIPSLAFSYTAGNQYREFTFFLHKGTYLIQDCRLETSPWELDSWWL